jgi:segregation and condensation protein B
MNLNEIAKIVEGVLFVAGEGVEIEVFKTRFDMNDREFNKCLDILKAKYNEKSGVNVITYKSKVQLCSNPDIVENISEILNPIRERSLTKAAMETAAIIAYKQPITRTEVENIRGANSDYAIQLLQSNNLIEVVGRKDTVGKPLLFGTTDNFLKRFELESIEQLPNYNELLDRIRVIHSDGESLYREFKIPDEEPAVEPAEQQELRLTENEQPGSEE